MMERQQQAGRFRQALGVLACVIALLTLACAAYRVVLVAVTDWYFRKGDLPGIEKAERLITSDARIHFARALAVQQMDPASADVGRELAQAVALNPRFSDAMLSWSVDKEFSGDKKGAEQLLLNARRIDRLLRPSWALANYYYRQGDSSRFWPEARECLRMIGVSGFTTGRYDPIPVFQLCWSMDPNAAKILSKAVPPSPLIEEMYLLYLLKNRDAASHIALAARMLERPSVPGDLPFLEVQINALISAGQILPAVREWNALIDRKLLPYQELDPSKGKSLTNGLFTSAPDGAGFNWRVLTPEAVRFSFNESEHSYRFDFDGTEPQQVELLSQTVPLLPNRDYQISAHYRAAFDAPQSGLNWVISANHTALPAHVVRVSGADDKTVELEFHTPAEVNAGNLQLSYARQPGTTLIRGSFDLLQTSLKLL